ncbi:hypothetical protein VB735_28820 [Halotia wernerae UHCC 0503]|nr:hypothetical protein [Halotia wernerae UHCC 0503]
MPLLVNLRQIKINGVFVAANIPTGVFSLIQILLGIKFVIIIFFGQYFKLYVDIDEDNIKKLDIITDYPSHIS